MPTFGGFDDESANRIARAVKSVERKRLGNVGYPPGRDGGPPVPVFIGKLVDTISGSCSGQAVTWGTTQASTAAEASLGTSETVRNWSTLAMSSGTNVLIFRDYASEQLYALGEPASSELLNNFTIVSTETPAIDVTFRSTDGKIAAGVPTVTILSWLNSSAIAGYSTVPTIQILGHTSTGLRYLLDADHCWIGFDSSGLFHKKPAGSTVQAACSTIHDFDVSAGLCRIHFDDAGHLHGMMTFTSSYLSPWGFADPAGP